jgi:electron transfer flavoprotein-quinone oxidoreductase
MAEDKFDAIIVGAGLAGCTSALLLARAGLEVLVVERGNFAGAKNMTGGRLYAHSLEKIIPGFAEEAPVERVIAHEKISLVTTADCVTLDFAAPPPGDPAARSYSVLRAHFDKWLADKAEAAGASLVYGIRVDELLVREGRVHGVMAGGEQMAADAVILADGVNSVLGGKLGLVPQLNPHHCAVGVKEVIGLDPAKINDRFGCLDGEGAAWLFAGMPSAGRMGGGFLYTNRESVSLGVVFGLQGAGTADISVPQMLENFKNHPVVRPLIAGGELLEYSAHVVPEGGLAMLPKLVADGVLVTGDAAGLCLNLGYTVRGMDLAIASGEAAANAVMAAKQAGDFSSSGLAGYKTALEGSFVMRDLRLHDHLPALLNNSRMYNEYPEMAAGILSDLFTIDGPSEPLRKMIMPHLRKVGLLNLLKDGIKGMRGL